MQAKSSFFVLQALDLATTLVAFHFGAFEVNPLVGRLTTLLGPTGGVLASKVIAVFVALRLRKLLWVANLFYLGVVHIDLAGCPAVQVGSAPGAALGQPLRPRRPWGKVQRGRGDARTRAGSVT
jgi:hypothetical protein